MSLIRTKSLFIQEFILMMIIYFHFSTSLAGTISCKSTEGNQKEIDKIVKNMNNDLLFTFAQNRSRYKSCLTRDDEVSFNFVNGDQLIVSLSSIAPGEQFFLAAPFIDESTAESLAIKTLPKLNGRPCKIDLKKPDVSYNEKLQQTTKSYWSEDIAAISVTLNKKNQVVKIRTWMIH